MNALAGDHVKVLVDGYALTGDSNRITVDDKRQMHDVTAFEDVVHSFILGRRQIGVEHAGYFNPEAAKSHPVLKDTAVSGVVSVLVGLNAMPVEGNPAYSLSIRQGHYKTMPEINKVVPFIAKFANRGESGGWGTILGAPQTAVFTNTANGPAVDNGAATTNGGAAYLHVLDTSGADTYTMIVEGATNIGFSTGVTTLATFTLNGSQLGSERVAIAGTIPQFTRWRVTRATGTAGDSTTIAVVLVRF